MININILFLPFVQQALITGVFVALSAPLVGMFLVHRKQSFLSDALSHASLIGVIAGVWAGFSVQLWIAAVTIFAAVLVELMKGVKEQLNDSYLVILLSGSLAASVLLNKYSPRTIRLESYLFGDLSLVSATDMWLSILLFCFVVGIFVIGWKKWFVMVLGIDLAKSSGINVRLWSVLLTVCTAIVVAVSMKVIGSLLTTSLIVLPVMASSILTSRMLSAVFLAQFIAVCAVFIGFLASLFFNLPSGAIITIILIVFFFIAKLLAKQSIR